MTGLKLQCSEKYFALTDFICFNILLHLTIQNLTNVKHAKCPCEKLIAELKSN